MTVVGIAMVRDEADVIAGTVRHMAGQVDQLLVADNGSVDGTLQLLHELARDLPLVVTQDRDPAYYQGVKMTRLATLAAATMGATWIVPFDADELWHAEGGRIADVLAAVRPPVAYAALTDHLRTALDKDTPDPFRSMTWRKPSPAPLPKVAFRWEPGATVHQGNHGVSLPSAQAIVDTLAGRPPALAVRHFPVRSPEQFARKARNGAAAYRAAPDLPADMGAHWRAWGQLYQQGGAELLAEVFREHWWYLSPPDAGLVHDPAPYQPQETRP
ncbi:glycosyltransferase family 2 protein [Frankia sp. AgPm24]|uniref:glycosyltransferase family 2 protein n=1 Tax=Frankia sp. AgPm24 TaxID=631128 RepID=UPI00200CB99C|nr:glycosyltransferase family 2 protein [Frankia sp. AgPm24]MCK9921601.1 glycosyltransferase family 2 protein [Frankia sp. AgPm24]